SKEWASELLVWGRNVTGRIGVRRSAGVMRSLGQQTHAPFPGFHQPHAGFSAWVIHPTPFLWALLAAVHSLLTCHAAPIFSGDTLRQGTAHRLLAHPQKN